jgi:hypothetical protein
LFEFSLALSKMTSTPATLSSHEAISQKLPSPAQIAFALLILRSTPSHMSLEGMTKFSPGTAATDSLETISIL